MAHTNSTTYYHLSQFVGSDIPNPLVDYNGDMGSIDTALHQIASDASAGDNRITVLETQNGNETLTTTAQTLSGAINELDLADTGFDTRLSTVESNQTSDESTLATAVTNISTLAGKVSAVETQNGDEVLTTTAQTLSGAINELDGDVSGVTTTLGGRITALETQNGSEVLATTAQTLSGAVNELEQAIESIPSATVDSAMSSTSTNAVQNKIIKAYVDNSIPSSTEEKQVATLTAGSTSVTLNFTEQTIGANTFVDYFCGTYGVVPTAVSSTSSSVTLTFDAQGSNMVVGVVVKN